MAQNLPSKIGKYQVLEVLGQGGMGTVYKGIDPLIGRLVAIKVIVADYIDNPELLKRFYREAKAVGNLQHPNIVIVYDLGEENKNPYLVMEYLDGEPLNKIIASRRELSLLQKLGIVTKVCDALSYAHQRDVVHRDVKPANVLLLKNGQVKLLDFGIARLGNSSYPQTETRKGQVMGTISYIAPEQLSEEIVDGRSDVYSTGVMLFELLTYRLPFESADLGSLIAKKMQAGPPPSLSKHLENYPPELDDIVGRALMRDRNERYNTAQDFAFDLERLIERLKRDMVSHYVERARACISSAELGKAKDILSEVLKIDTQHTAARQLLYEVQQSLQKQQRGEHIRQLRQHAEEAITLKEFDDASKFVEEAIRLDKTDPDLLNLRERIQQAKQRAQQMKKLLHLAEVAQESGEPRVFEKAVAEALALDPEDPQVRVLQASLIRLQAEQEKETRVQELLVAARREIATRQFDVAQEYILKAEALDPHRNDIPSLRQMVIAGQEQEARKRQLQRLCAAIQQELETNNLLDARDLAEKALRTFPGEPALLRMKSAADSQLEAEERRRFVEARIGTASKLLEAGDVSRALSLIQEASRQFPTDPRLRDFLQTVREAVQLHTAKRDQLDLLAQARAAMQQKRFADAVEVLEAGQIKYPDLREVADLLSLARKEQELLAQKNKVADVSEQARTLVAQQAFGDALSLLEKTLVDTSDPSLQQFLQRVRAQAAEFEESLDALKKEAMALLNAGHPEEALMRLQSQAGKFGHSAGFTEFLQQVEEQVTEEQESRQQVARVLAEAFLPVVEGFFHEVERKALAFARPAGKWSALRLGALGGSTVLIAVIGYLSPVIGHLSVGRPIIPIKPAQYVHIRPDPDDSTVTLDRRPVTDGAAAVGATVEVSHLGYITKRAQVQRESDGKIKLEPEPMHVSIQTSAKSGTVELDGQRISDLTDGSMDDYTLVPDGTNHKLTVISQEKPLFAVDFQAIAGSRPQVTASVTNDLLVVTSLGKGATVYGGNLLKSVRIGDQNVPVLPSGADLNLTELSREISFGEGKAEGSIAIDISNAPVLTVHSLTTEGQLKISTDAQGANLTVDGVPVRRQKGGWLITGLVGFHTFIISAEGYPTRQWTMTLLRGQSLKQFVPLPRVQPPVVALLDIQDGTPGADVYVDGNREGQIDANGKLIIRVQAGVHTVAISKQNYESKVIKDINVSKHVLFPNAALTPTRP